MTANNITKLESPSFIDKLNSVWHEKAMWIYGLIVILHQVEHVLQAVQIFILNMPRPESQGLLGLFFPVLVQSEVLHTVYAIITLAGLLLLTQGIRGRARTFWIIAIVLQSWHFIEHALLQGQAVFGANLFGAAVPTSVGQLWVARPELHLIYNFMVTIPTVLAMYYHMYPPAGEAQQHLDCTCSRRAA